MNFDNIPQLTATLAILTTVCERLVETIKKLIYPLSERDDASWKQNLIREGAVSALSIICGIAVVAIASCAKILPGQSTSGTELSGFSIVIFGLVVAGGTRAFNPAIEWLKAVKDAKVNSIKGVKLPSTKPV